MIEKTYWQCTRCNYAPTEKPDSLDCPACSPRAKYLPPKVFALTDQYGNTIKVEVPI